MDFVVEYFSRRLETLGLHFQHHQKIKIKKSEVLKPGNTFLLKCYTLKDNG